MESDLTQLDFESSETQSTSRSSRRRRSLVQQSNGNATAIHDSSPFADIMGSSPVPPTIPRTRRLATWGDDTIENIQQLQNLDQLAKANKQKFDNSDDVMPLIPDIDEVRDQELIQQTAKAPTLQVNQLISFQELDKNALKNSVFTSLDGIDLTPLTNFCLTESQVKEEDITWNWDNLMSDITSKLMKDNNSNIN